MDSEPSALIMYAVFFSISIVVSLLILAANWKIYTKAGEAGWKSLIPIYNTYVLYKIVYGSGWKFLLLFVPILGEIVAIVFCFRLAQAFGKGFLFGLGILLFPYIALLDLGFGRVSYQGPTFSFI